MTPLSPAGLTVPLQCPQPITLYADWETQQEGAKSAVVLTAPSSPAPGTVKSKAAPHPPHRANQGQL